MAKLYFRYGAMTSAKTMNMLAVAHNYRQQGKKVLLVKPRLDDRFGAEMIRSRAGLEERSDICASEDTRINPSDVEGISCILVDEVQFIAPALIEQLRDIATFQDIPVICYGLRTDFRSHLFEGSKRMMELADSIEEIKTTCQFCNRKATMSLRHTNGVATLEGPSINLGAEESYFPTCYKCYRKQLDQAKV